MSDWHTNNLERPGDDALYGKGHRPTATWFDGWYPACVCSPNCRRANDDGFKARLRPYPSDVDALDAAAINLREHEHGPSDRRTA